MSYTEYVTVENCKNHLHIGFAGHLIKKAPQTSEANCKKLCTDTADCDYFAYEADPDIPIPGTKQCYCGGYDKVGASFSVPAATKTVTLKYKKGNIEIFVNSMILF